MDAINFMESPVVTLQRQSVRRMRALIVVLIIWIIMMGALLAGAHVMKQHSETKLQKITVELQAIQGRVAYQQYVDALVKEQHTAQCTARTLTALLSRRVEGLHLTSLSFSGKWEISGGLDYPKALDDFKFAVADDVESSKWTEQFVENSLRFHMEGTQAC